MSQVSIMEICQTSLFDDREKLLARFTEERVEHVMRIRDMYLQMMNNPTMTDRQFVEMYKQRYNMTKTPAYQDLAVVKALLPLLSKANRDFHRWRANCMFLETYERAKKHNDFKTMERAASAYAKFNRVDVEDEQQIPWDQIVVQPFVPTSDPSVIGIKPMTNLRDNIDRLMKKYKISNPDIVDVDFEEADLQEEKYFPKPEQENEGDIL